MMDRNIVAAIVVAQQLFAAYLFFFDDIPTKHEQKSRKKYVSLFDSFSLPSLDSDDFVALSADLEVKSCDGVRILTKLWRSANLLGYTLLAYSLALGAFIGVALAILCNKNFYI